MTMKRYIITAGNKVGFIDAREADTLQGAKRQQTLLLEDYDCSSIWLRSPESADYKACLVEIHRDGSSTGNMRDFDSVDYLL